MIPERNAQGNIDKIKKVCGNRSESSTKSKIQNRPRERVGAADDAPEPQDIRGFGFFLVFFYFTDVSLIVYIFK